MKICVEKSTWSGWDSEEIPASANYEFEVDYGTEYVVDEVEADADHVAKIFSFKINKVRELYIEIKTNIKMIDTSKTNAEESEGDYYFEIREGKVLTLTTPTLDEGDTYKFTLKDA
ncbi:MAG: hypothetical protein IKL55_01590 [Clostridia bacterium]|nr:hypothetical protein [Clostridia bacterium]